MTRRYPVALLSAIALGLACAEVAAPPGGEIDKSAPILTQVFPADGSTNVAPTDRIVLQFSERVVEPTAVKAFFVSPRFDREPEVKWRGDRVEILFPDTIAPNQTYVISLSSSIADLRGNKFDSAGTIAFSTGPTLDSGRVGGRVTKGGVPSLGLLAALYDAGLFGTADSTVWDSLLPTYIATTNQQGQFQFAYLPIRKYRLVVFQDRNGNERLNPARESFAVSDRPVAIGGVLPLQNLSLGLTSQDTTSPQVVAASYTADRLVRLRLGRAIPMALLLADPAHFVLRPAADTARAVEALAILETDEDSSATVSGFFGEPDTGLYLAQLTYDLRRPALVWDSLRVARAEDRSAPAISSFQPVEGAHFLRDMALELTVSEPLDTAALTPETFALWRQRDSVRVPAPWTWRDPLHLVFDKSELREGESYRMAITEFDLRDRGGNAAGDSLREYRFSTLDADSLGSIAGEVTIHLPDRLRDPIVLNFRKVGQTENYRLPVDGNSFVIDVPAGDYLLSGFIDSNKDGALSLGSVAPFRLAETQAALADTISVRARFQTAGIEIIFE